MFNITVLPQLTMLGIVAEGERKYKGSQVTYHWEIEALDNGMYWLYIDGDNEEIDFKSIKDCKDYMKNL